MRIGICDDDKGVREKIESYCREYEKINGCSFQYSSYESGEEVLLQAKEGKEDIDLLFLDIEMKGIDGIEVMKQIKNLSFVWRIVFVSSHEESVFDVFSIKTLGFVRKPFSYEDIAKWLQEAYKKYKEKVVVEFNMNGEKKLVAAEDIIYLSGEKNYTTVVTTKERFIVYGNLKAWEEKMRKINIIRVHKSFLVSLMHIKGIKDSISLLNQTDLIPIGRKYKEQCKQLYTNYLFQAMKEGSLF